MRLAPYKSVLAIPGMRTFMLVSLIARLPGTATGTSLTLSVVLDLHRGYGDAGLVTAAYTIGLAVGSPLLGRLVDRRGPRPVMVVTGLSAVAFWFTAPQLSYNGLVLAAVFGGALQVPIMALVRQSMAARVPQEQRRQAYSLDSMAVELSFMIGPAVAILAITQLGDATSTMWCLGVALAGAAAVMFAYNPRVGSSSGTVVKAAVTAAAATEGTGGAVSDLAASGTTSGVGAIEPKGPNWLAPGFLLTLGVAGAAALVLAGTDVSIVATLREHGQVQWAGAVIAAWCLASMIGGFIHGAMPKPFTMLTLAVLLGALTIPVGVAHHWLLLSLLLFPAGLACAPTLASTVDAVSRAIPESARGEAIGRHSAALTVGNAMGAPLAGLVIDHSSPAFGFVTVGAVGAALALLGLGGKTLHRTRRDRPRGGVPVPRERVAVEAEPALSAA